MSFLPADLQAAGEPEQAFDAASCPTLLGGVYGITFTITGTWTDMRIGFTESGSEQPPFYPIPEAGTHTVTPSDASVPIEWDVPNAGALGLSNVLLLTFQAASVVEDAPFDFCLSNITINE
jgi:hypothetical protein